MPSNKKEEIREIKNFLSNLDSPPQGEKSFNEEPDCVIKGEISLGIEHTRLYQPETQNGIIIQSQEAKRDEIVSRAEQIYKENGNEAVLVVSITFYDNYRLDGQNSKFGKSKMKNLPNAIYKIVSNNIPELGKSIILNILDGVDLPDGLDSISIWNAGYDYGHRWSQFKGGTPARFSQEILQEAINSHNDKVEKYLKKCEKIWFLVVEDNFSFERSLNFSGIPNFMDAKYNFNFDKVFLFRNRSNRIFKLQSK